MRTITYSATVMRGSSVKHDAPLSELVLSELRLSREFHGAIPPDLGRVNEILRSGVGDEAMGGLSWKPFEIDEAEMLEIRKAIVRSPREV